MGKHHTRDILGNHLKDRSFRSVHWFSITLFLRKTSQESIILERKSYLDCSLDTLCTRGEFGKVTYWLQTLRSWKRWTHQKSTRKYSMRKRWYFPKKKGEFIFPIADGRIKLSGRDQELRTSTLIREHTIGGEGHVDFLGEWEGSNPPPQDSLPDASEAINDFWSMWGNFIYRHHGWTQSRTLLAGRRIIPYSTEVHWRYQNYSYEFGCQAREAHWWPLEHRWVKRFVWFLDRFHSVYSIRRETSRRIFVVRVETDKRAVSIQASPMKKNKTR